MADWYEYNHEKPSKEKISDNKKRSVLGNKKRARRIHPISLYIICPKNASSSKKSDLSGCYRSFFGGSKYLWFSTSLFDDHAFEDEFRALREEIDSEVFISVYYLAEDADGELKIVFRSRLLALNEDDLEKDRPEKFVAIENNKMMTNKSWVKVSEMTRCKGPKLEDYRVLSPFVLSGKGEEATLENIGLMMKR